MTSLWVWMASLWVWMTSLWVWMASLWVWMTSLWVWMASLWTWMVSLGTTWKNSNRLFEVEKVDFLRWQKESFERLSTTIPSLEKFLKEIEDSPKTKVLNKNQCVHLFRKLISTMKGIGKILSIATKNLGFNVIFMRELCCLQMKVEMMGKKCIQQDHWCQAAVFQLRNKEAFRELVLDLKCCYDTACDMFLIGHSSLTKDIISIQFDVANFEEVQDDERVLKERLELVLSDTASVEYELAKHLFGRLRNLDRVEGGELDALEVPNDFKKPKLFYGIGCRASPSVYKSIFFDIPSATKVVKGNLEDTSFRIEAGILSGLSHPNLIQFIGCGSNKEVNELYLVMELMKMNLTNMLKKSTKPLSYFLAIDVMHQIANGMYYLHDMHVVHLDLKPDNVLTSSIITKDFGIPFYIFKLTDYGTSNLEVSTKSKFERSKYIVGTKRYMAPEVNTKSPACMKCSFQADVWSFAMTCSEILSKKKPYSKEEQLQNIFQRITNGERPALPSNCKELTDLIEDCWEIDPLKRPTFSIICERLTDLKKKFLMGTYSDKMIPFFDERQESRASKDMKDHETNMLPNDTVVGLEDQVSKAKGCLEMNYLGIVGMGGIGKTTLAKAIFDDVMVKSTYEASCFVANLKNRDSLDIICEIIQKLGNNQEATNLEHAQKMMKEQLVKKKVLLILDDIKDQAEVENIVPPDIVRISKGTTIIVTTRNWSAIKHFVEEKGKIEVGMLDEKAALALFSAHLSWDEACLTPQFLDFRQKIVESCKGLPLSLKVMGAFLHRKKRLRSWERALQRMKRGRNLDGDEAVWNTLRISFDGLKDDLEKNIFLDIACFFCKDVYPDGISEERALYIWTHNDISPIHALETLKDMSLIKINKINAFLEMHDQLRDMGRMIAEKDIQYKGTRIWKASMIPFNGLTSKVIF